jgi:predicted acyl esterase
MRLHVSLPLALILLPIGGRAQTAPSPPAFERAEVMIPMRDGVRLHTDLHAGGDDRLSADAPHPHSIRN